MGGSTYNCRRAVVNQFQINNPDGGPYSTTVSRVPRQLHVAVSTGANKDRSNLELPEATSAAISVVGDQGRHEECECTADSTPAPTSRTGTATGTTQPPSQSTSVRRTPSDSGCTSARRLRGGSPFSVRLITTFCFTLPTSARRPVTARSRLSAFGGTGGTVDYSAQLVANGASARPTTSSCTRTRLGRTSCLRPCTP